MVKLENSFAPIKIPNYKKSNAGDVGVDNKRENIDPHIVTSVIDCNEIKQNGKTITHLFNFLHNGADITMTGSGTKQYIFPDSAGTLIGNAGVNAYTASTATITSSGVEIPITQTICEITTDGDSDENNGTLANGTVGQIIYIGVKAVGNAADSFKITPATMIGGSKISFAANCIGKGATLVYTSNGWICLGTNGGVVS